MASEGKPPALFVVTMLRGALGVGRARRMDSGEAGQVCTAVTWGPGIVALPWWLLGASGTSTVRLKLCPFSFFNFYHGNFQLDRRVGKYINTSQP